MWERLVTEIKINRIPLFDVGRSMFDVHLFLLTIKLAAYQARGNAEN